MNGENEDSSLKKGRHRKKQLYNTILQQMEFYFSDSNLSKDRFLSQLIQEDPYVDLNQFLKFNKIRKLTSSIDDLRKAIKKSDILELSENSEKIKRKTEIKLKDNVDDCTIYVERISSEANHEFLSSIFSDFGNVVYVSIPKYKHNHLNKGFAFIEFEDEKDTQNALNYFEKIGCKMSSNINPQDLRSISSFVEETKIIAEENDIQSSAISEDTQGLKRKSKDEDEGIPSKKLKNEEAIVEVTQIESDGKKKKRKDHKKKNLIKELGLQVLSKQEWKKMRNGYLNLQRKKMKEVKKHLYMSKYPKLEKDSQEGIPNSTKSESPEEKIAKLEYIPGTIVKITLPEHCQSDKKMKMDIKSVAKDLKYVDAPLGSKDVFVRFSSSEAAQNFCQEEFNGVKVVLDGKEEKEYWNKINNDRNNKFEKSKKKMRGKDKLLRKAEKHLIKHTRFDENE